jgi:PAS domain S-box-containing protein
MEPVAVNAVIAADGSGRITHFNPAAERTFGYIESEVLGNRSWSCSPPATAPSTGSRSSSCSRARTL